MPRVNVWLPDELHRVLKERLADLNVSQLLQDAIRGVLQCRHVETVCAVCAEPIDQHRMVDDALGRFYYDLMWELGRLLDAGGTLEGAARLLKELGGRHQVSVAARVPLPRLTRAQRAAQRAKQPAADQVADLPREEDSRARHPTARRSPARAPQRREDAS